MRNFLDDEPDSLDEDEAKIREAQLMALQTLEDTAFFQSLRDELNSEFINSTVGVTDPGIAMQAIHARNGAAQLIQRLVNYSNQVD